MSNNKNKNMLKQIERGIGVEQTKEKEKIAVRIGVISDTQDIKNPEKVIEKLKMAEQEKPFDFVIHLGDLAPSGKLSEYVKEYKILSAKLREQEQTGEFTDEIMEFKKLIESEDYKKFKKEAEQADFDSVAIYPSYIIEKAGQAKKIFKNIEENNERTIKALKSLKSPVIHQMGNADKGTLQKVEILKKLFDKYELTSYSEPQLMDFGETAMISWPSVGTKDPKIRALLTEKIREFVPKLTNKKQVIILGHEQPFKGPALPGIYRKRIEKAGHETVRYPAAQFKNIAKYALKIFKQLPPETKMTYLCGHLHDPTEIIEAGIPYLKRKSGQEKIEMRLFGFGEERSENYKDFKGRKTFDIIYLPQGTTGILEVTKNGEITFEKN